ncbi:MAG: T9SS type A sorting domain-containing protein, partial [Bacteroidetes bacterium]
TMNWYNVPSGGSSQQTGGSYTTPSISSTTTYYVDATDNGCTSARTSVAATVNTTPSISGTTPGWRCDAGTVDLSATGSAGTLNWYAASSGGSSLQTGGSYTTPSISSTTTYYVDATDNGCTSARTAVAATVYDCSKLDGSSCGKTLATLDEAINSEAVAGATDYRYLVSHSGTGFTTLSVRSGGDNLFRLTWLTSGIKYGTTYNVRVSAFVSGQWEPYGDVCTITTPATKLTAATCGTMLSSTSDELQCYPVAGATNYRYEVRHWGSSFYALSERGNANTNFRLSWISGITQESKTYQVRVAAYVDGAWQAYGPYCSVTTPVTSTKLQAAYCDQSVSALSDALYCETVPGATNYRYEVKNGGAFVGLSTRGSGDNLFRLSWLSGTSVGPTYTIRVAAYANGMWGDYGDACTVSTVVSMGKEVVDAKSGATQFIETAELSVYPNPNDGNFVIHSTHEGTYRIVNSLGQMVKEIELSSAQGNSYEVKDLKQGIYFVTGTIQGEVITKKLIVRK